MGGDRAGAAAVSSAAERPPRPTGAPGGHGLARQALIRSAGTQDFESVLSLWGAAGGLPTVTDTRDGLERLLDADPQALLLAESAGTVIGSLIAVWDGWRGSFYRLAVQPSVRRQGVASALLARGERRLRDLGAIRLTAIVDDESPAAMSFWEAAGYTRQSQRTRFVRMIR